MPRSQPFLTPTQRKRVRRVMHEDKSAVVHLETPEELHALACSYNWDDDLAPILWLVENPFCDRATALQIFWSGDIPDMYLDNEPPWDETEYKVRSIINTVVIRLLAEQYPTERYYFDPAEEYDLAAYPNFPKALTRPALGAKVRART